MKTNRLVLVSPPSVSHRTPEENLGIGYIATVLRRSGFEVTIIDAWLHALSLEETVRAILSKCPLVYLGISSYRTQLDDVYRITELVRQEYPDTVVIAGGFGPTFSSQDFLNSGIDFVVSGEGEFAAAALALAIKEGTVVPSKIPGIAWKDGGEFLSSGKPYALDMSTLPHPARDSIAQVQKLQNPVHISTSRGCSANCIFCSIAAFATKTGGHRWRGRSVADVVDEIYRLHHVNGVTCFKIVDDSFIDGDRDERWCIDLANQLHNRNLRIRFRTQVRSDKLTEGIVAPLVSAGWFATSIGVENGSPTALQRMNKEALLEDNLRALALLEKYGVYVTANMILFDHATTLKELGENLYFFETQHWAVFKSFFTEMYAADGTPYRKVLEKRGALGTHKNFMNSQYNFADEGVALVYSVFKHWHKQFTLLYDKATNPINAPKDIAVQGYEEYRLISLEMKRIILDFFSQLLTDVSGGVVTRVNWREYADAAVKKSQSVWCILAAQVELLDERYHLIHDAIANPF